MLEGKCTSCGVSLVDKGSTKFKCPSCGEAEIGRCMVCRDQGVPYECPECGFRGP